MLESLAKLGGGLSGGIDLPDTADYTARAGRGVRLLAEGCGLAGDTELERFRSCHKKLTVPITPDGGDLLEVVGSAMGLLPVTYELVLVYRGDGPAGFGYLTQGSNAKSAAGLRLLLQTGLELYLESGSPHAGAEMLVELFALAFPDPNALAEYRSSAQAMVLCLVPRPEGVQLKAYFNTRMYIDGDHRGRVRRIVARTGAGTERFDEVYDLLYDEKRGCRFMGVGADIDGSGRAKLYVRLDTAGAFDHLARVGDALEIPIDIDTLRNNFASDDLANEMEIAIGLRGEEPPTIKWTTFFPGNTERPSVREATERLIRRYGYEPELFGACFDSLVGEKPKTRLFPLHAVGLELPEAERAKVNLYLQPTS